MPRVIVIAHARVLANARVLVIVAAIAIAIVIEMKSQEHEKNFRLFDGLVDGSRANLSPDLGQKGMELVRLAQDGFPVPRFWILKTDIITHSLQEGILDSIKDEFIENGLNGRIDLLAARLDEILKKGEDCLKSRLLKKIGDELAVLPADKEFSVRSSTNLEDERGASFAGIFYTCLNVRKDGILDAIITCIRSCYSEHVLSYCIANNVNPASVEMAVIIQEMIKSIVSGVMITEPGQAIALVEVSQTGDETRSAIVAISLANRKISTMQNSGILHGVVERLLIDNPTILPRIIRKERGARDMEWAFDGKWWFLQDRPYNHTFPVDLAADQHKVKDCVESTRWALKIPASSISVLFHHVYLSAFELSEDLPFEHRFPSIRAFKSTIQFSDPWLAGMKAVFDKHEQQGTLKRALSDIIDRFNLLRDRIHQSLPKISQGNYDDRREVARVLANLFDLLRQFDAACVVVPGFTSHLEHFLLNRGASDIVKVCSPSGVPSEIQFEIDLVQLADEVRAVRVPVNDSVVMWALNLDPDFHKHFLDVFERYSWLVDEEKHLVDLIEEILFKTEFSIKELTKQKLERERSFATLASNLRPDLQEYLGLYKAFLYMRTELKDVKSQLRYGIKRVLKSLSTKLSIDPDDFLLLTPSESIAAAETLKLPVDLPARKNGIALLLVDSFVHVFSGQSARIIEGNNQDLASHDRENTLTGDVIIQAQCKGIVHLVQNANDAKSLERGEIAVIATLTSTLIPFLVAKASAIITERGGFFSHGALLAREFGIPCVVNVRNATNVLKSGSLIEIEMTSSTATIMVIRLAPGMVKI